MTQELLRNLYCFKNLKKDELTELERISTVEKRAKGTPIFSQGDTATAMYVIKYGTVQINQNTAAGEAVTISTQGTGSHFGEMAFLAGEKRTATADVMEDSEIIVISYDRLQTLLESNPRIAAHFYRALAIFLAHRLGETSRDLGFAREKMRKHA